MRRTRISIDYLMILVWTKGFVLVRNGLVTNVPLGLRSRTETKIHRGGEKSRSIRSEVLLLSHPSGFLNERNLPGICL